MVREYSPRLRGVLLINCICTLILGFGHLWILFVLFTRYGQVPQRSYVTLFCGWSLSAFGLASLSIRNLWKQDWTETRNMFRVGIIWFAVFAAYVMGTLTVVYYVSDYLSHHTFLNILLYPLTEIFLVATIGQTITFHLSFYMLSLGLCVGMLVLLITMYRKIRQ